MTTETTQKPAKIFRIGSVSASIWKRVNGDEKSYFTVQFSRSYRNDEGTQYTDSFNHADLPILTLLVHRAEEWVALQHDR